MEDEEVSEEGYHKSTVQIRNLATVLQRAGRDAWGRAGKAQPARLSAEVAFAAGFAAAAAGDALGAGDTVHYGVLSKAVLACVARFEAQQRQQQQQQQQQRGEGEVILAGGEGQEEGLGQAREGTVRELLQALWAELTGLGLDGGEPRKEAFLDLGKVRLLSVAVALPKASLLGEGVSLTASAVFEEGTGRMEARAVALEISRLRVPTLVGVNANERLAKQFVLTTVTIDGFDGAEDAYTEIEAVVVKVSVTNS
ncbi:e74de566-e9c7-4ebf-9317-cd7f71053182 [Thermothielavioides terrestris]|uniref:E74de566-e9c7-4ebf-9317-cd7f71053182 n=1 Tax=Thermothielavioides terrestris TaxID=2587410 RepID=A0A446B6S9_9PEZI|nr:e74de566-e9c7-4ebf-9317-cd7f71053182 [Thermothielavioides terrestris]